METVDFILGFGAGALVMWAAHTVVIVQWRKDLEKLKDFDTWKEWKNK